MTYAATHRSVPRPLVLLGTGAALLALLTAGFLAAPGTAGAGKAKKQRIVSISPFATDVLAKVGVKPKAIGQVLSDRRGMKRIPKKFRHLRVLPLSHPNGPNLEQLARIRPTIVFSSTRWSRGTPAMKRLGIRVVYVDPVRIGQAYPSVRKVGRVVRRKKRANRLVRTMRRQVRSATRGIRKRPRVMGILGIGRNPMTFLGNSWGGQIIKAAGGRLLTGGATNPGGFAPVSDEVVVAQNPNAMIAVPHGSVTDIGTAVDYILENPAWQTVRAVEDGMVFPSTDNRLLQAGTDIGQTIRIVRRWLSQVPSS